MVLQAWYPFRCHYSRLRIYPDITITWTLPVPIYSNVPRFLRHGTHSDIDCDRVPAFWTEEVVIPVCRHADEARVQGPGQSQGAPPSPLWKNICEVNWRWSHKRLISQGSHAYSSAQFIRYTMGSICYRLILFCPLLG